MVPEIRDRGSSGLTREVHRGMVLPLITLTAQMEDLARPSFSSSPVKALAGSDIKSPVSQKLHT